MKKPLHFTAQSGILKRHLLVRESENMNKSELITAVSGTTGVSRKDTEQVVSAALALIAQSLAQGQRVQLSGFGTFECKEREARVGRNPHTLEAISIPATRVATFKCAKALKDQLGK
jgi:DNA-binding protein HU-beta